MRKSIAVISLAAFGAFVLGAARLPADVVPPIGLARGSQYQLVFVTQDKTAATNPSGAFYNSFVRSEAALSPSLPTGVTWNAVIASLDGTIPLTNAPSGGLPVYNTAGQLVSSAATGLYVESLLNPIVYSQFGTINGNFVWTGSFGQGGASFGGVLGQPFPAVGLSATEAPGWIADNHFFANSNFLSLYALSSPIGVPTPEPSSLVLAALGFIALAAWRLRRR